MEVIGNLKIRKSPKIQKQKVLKSDEVKILKGKNLIEERKPNYHISLGVAKRTKQKISYIKQKAFDDQYYKDLILGYLKKFSEGKRTDFDDLLLNKLPDELSQPQKKDKVKNLLQALKQKETIQLKEDKRTWFLL